MSNKLLRKVLDDIGALPCSELQKLIEGKREASPSSPISALLNALDGLFMFIHAGLSCMYVCVAF